MPEPPQTVEGWYGLHDIRRIDWPRWKALPEAEREAALTEAVALWEEWLNADPQQGSSGIYQMVGHKGDMMFIHFRPEIGQLADLERQFARTRLADFTIPTYSFLSVAELSRHSESGAGGDGSPAPLPKDPALLRRLRPQVPREGYACFYPMSKKRDGADNWYMLPLAERRDLMMSHGLIGRNYAGRVSQVIGGSVGLDDWEWGVTLFAADPLPFKKIVYEMRFDEASARYGLFGPFYVGIATPPAVWPELLRT